MREKTVFIFLFFFFIPVISFAEQKHVLIYSEGITDSKDVVSCGGNGEPYAGYYIVSPEAAECLRRLKNKGELKYNISTVTPFYEVDVKYSRGACCFKAGNRCFILTEPQNIKNFNACTALLDEDENNKGVFKPTISLGKFEPSMEETNIRLIAEAKGNAAAKDCYLEKPTELVVCEGQYNTEVCRESFKKGYEDAAATRDLELENYVAMGYQNKDTTKFDCTKQIPEGPCRIARIAACRQGQGGRKPLNSPVSPLNIPKDR